MTPEQLRSVIAAGESLDVEFKGEERGRLSDDDLLEAVVCLANRSSDAPAWLLIGVEDEHVQAVVDVLRDTCRPPDPGHYRATIFVIDAVHFEQI